jgi:hypothetical protein
MKSRNTEYKQTGLNTTLKTTGIQSSLKNTFNNMKNSGFLSIDNN